MPRWHTWTRFSFQREARWMFVFIGLVPLIGIIAVVVVPALVRWWQG